MATRPNVRRIALCTAAVASLATPGALAAQACAPAMPLTQAPLLSALVRAYETASGDPPARFLVRASDDLVRCPALWDALGAVRLGPLRIAPAPTVGGMTFNSGYADDRNNGAVWTGRGASLGLETGVAAQLGPLTAGFRPTLAWQQNRDFATRPLTVETRSAFANTLYPGQIDLPHRFGDESFATTHVGQSFARLDAFGLAAGFASENYWVGPAIRNPILMSNTAPGFTHAFAGTSRPLDLWLARVELDVVFGRTAESDYWDFDPANDRGYLVQWVAGIEPRGLSGLELGAARTLHYRSPDARWYGDPAILREFFFLEPAKNIEGNELASLFFRWVLRESRAEFYGEWARNDRWENLTDDFIPEVDHSQAYMFGFQKLTPFGARDLRIHAELSHLQEKVERRLGRPLPVFYTHGTGGTYTNLGQLMGSSIGPGADAQFVGVDVIDERGFVGVFVERVRRYDGANPAFDAREQHPFEHDTELTGGTRALLFWRDLALGGSLSYSHRWNREFHEDDTNLRFVGEVSWRPFRPETAR